MSTVLQIAEALQKQFAELRRDLLRPRQSTHLGDVVFREADAYAILRRKIETAAVEWYRERNYSPPCAIVRCSGACLV